jgi:hypothetical protein
VFPSQTANSTTTQTVTTGSTILYGIASHVTRYVSNPAINVHVTDSAGNVILRQTQTGVANYSNGKFTVPVIVEGVIVSVTAHVSNASSDLEIIVWTDAGAVTTTDQQ